MDALILAANFVHNKAKTRVQFSRALQKIAGDMNDADKVLHVTQALQSLEKRLLEEGRQPLFETEGWRQVMDTYSQISDFFGKNYKVLYDSDRAVIAKVHADFFSFLVHILEKKVTPLNLQVACKCVQDRNTDMAEYIQKLEDQSLGALIALCQQMKPEDVVNMNEYCESHQQFMRVLIQDTLTEEQRAAHTIDLLDISVSLQLGWIDDPGDHLKTLVDTGKMILDQLDEPFIKTLATSASKIKSYIKQCREILQRPSFPSSKIAASCVRSFLDNLFCKLGKNFHVEKLVSDVFDLLVDITRCHYQEENYDVKLFTEVFCVFKRLPKLAKSAEQFKIMTVKFTEVLEAADMRFLNNGTFCCTILDDYLFTVSDNKEVAQNWLEMLVPLLRKPCNDTMRACVTILFHDMYYTWKDFTDIGEKVFDLLADCDPDDKSRFDNEQDKTNMKEFYCSFKLAIEYFFDGRKKSEMLKISGQKMSRLTLKLMGKENTELLVLSDLTANKIELNAKNDRKFMVSLMKEFSELLRNKNHLWDESWPLHRAACDFIERCMKPFKNGKDFEESELQLFVHICQICQPSLGNVSDNPDSNKFPSTYLSIFIAVIKVLFEWLTDSNRMDLADQLMLQLIFLSYSENETVVQVCCECLSKYRESPSGRAIMAPHIEEILQIYLDTRQDILLYTVSDIYSNNSKLMETQFHSLMDLLKNTTESNVVTYIGMLFQKVSKLQAELFTDEDIQVLLTKAQHDPNSQTSLLDVCRELCKRRPNSFMSSINSLMDNTLWNTAVLHLVTEMLCMLAIFREDKVSEVLESMFLTLESYKQKHILLATLNAVRMIGVEYPDSLESRKDQIKKLKLDDNVATQESKQMLLNTIDKKLPEENLKEIQRQQQSLICKVDETQNFKTEANNKPDKQKQQLNNAGDSPVLFISYKRDKKENIMKLYERLTSSGFTCWLDDKILKVGNKLDKEIGKGLRGCRIVLCCVTENYNIAPNCIKEVERAKDFQKPLLPLLLEKSAWPPSGSIGNILGKKLYIDFTKDKNIQETWDGPPFQQLLEGIKHYLKMPMPEDQAACAQQETQIVSVAATPSAENDITNSPASEVDTKKTKRSPEDDGNLKNNVRNVNCLSCWST